MNIPQQALEAGARVQFKNEYPETEMVWEDCNEYEQAEYRRQARAAFLAIVEAWPGMRIDDTYRWLSNAAIILPMEDKNAES